MKISHLAWRQIVATPIQSGLVFTCTLLVSSLLLSTSLITRGAQDSLQLVQSRLGADIVVVPEGVADDVGMALLMGQPVESWMPAQIADQIAHIPGVERISTQLYLSSLANAPCCSAKMFVMAFDPATDFTVAPWLSHELGQGLQTMEAIGGSDIFVPYGEQYLLLYGSEIDLRAILEPTGTGLDTTLFLTFDTAERVAEGSLTRAVQPLQIPADSISAALIRVTAEFDPRVVALQIMHDVPGVTAVPSPRFFQTFQNQLGVLRRDMLFVLSATSALSLLLIGSLFAIAAYTHRREIGVLRALGATRGEVFKTLILEVVLLTLSGGAVGAALASLGVYLFRNLIIASTGVTFLFPGWPKLLALAFWTLSAAIVGVTVATLLPSIWISSQDPTETMRA
jgi:putative ABC transport system permease protein